MKKLFLVSTLVMSMVVSAVPAFAATEYAYSIGTEYSDIDTSGSAEYAANNFSIAGYKSYYNIKPTLSYLTGDNPAGNPRLSSSILFFAGHANYDNIGWDYLGKGKNKCGVYYKDSFDSKKSGYSYAGLNDYDLSDTRLAMFMGCKTGAKSTNLVTQAIDNGASCAIGWKDSVNTDDATKWRKKFVDGLALGKTIKSARNYADALSYDDDRVLETNLKGSSSDTITISGKRSASTLSINDAEDYADGVISDILAEDIVEIFDLEHNDYVVDDKLIFDLNDADYTDVSNYIKSNINPEFDVNMFNEYIYADDSNNGKVILRFVKDSVETNCDIKFFVEDGYVTYIATNGEFNDTSSSRFNMNSIADLSEDDVCDLALANADYDENNSKVVNQVITKKIDTATNSPYYVVLTDFEDVDSGNFFSEKYVHKFN